MNESEDYWILGKNNSFDDGFRICPLNVFKFEWPTLISQQADEQNAYFTTSERGENE